MQAEIVEQVLALATDETAKTHVARRATAAHLVHAAAANHGSPLDHRCAFCACLDRLCSFL